MTATPTQPADLLALVAKWREDARSEVSGDFFLAQEECADELENALAAHRWEVDPVDADNAKLADCAALAMIGNGYVWDGGRWYPTTHRRRRPEDAATQEAIGSMLNRMSGWAKAYPIDVFSEVTKEECEWLRDTHPGLMDRIAASMGRHMAKCMAEDLAALTAVLTKEST